MTTKPFETTGRIEYSGDPKLDGPVKDAFELIEKLAHSKRVEQVFVRHVFRYFMGRNETLADGPILVAAHKAYRENGGSFNALLVSLLTSDAFLYRTLPGPPADAAAARANKQSLLPSQLQKPSITNSIGMRLAHIPAGKFSMGSPEDEVQRESQEQQHNVVLTKAFYLGAHEVTVGQFRAFVNDTGYETEAVRDGMGSWGVISTGKFERDAKYNWKNPGFEQTGNHPVVAVSWRDAKAFCKWLSGKEKKNYRLPTEAEWEYACRAGTSTAYSFGDDPEDLPTAGNIADATARALLKAWSLGVKGEDRYAHSAPVGQFKPNRFGLYDMHGNVWEWCADWYEPQGYSRQQQTDPKGPETGEIKVHRGGGWSSAAERCRSASRIGRHYSRYRGCYLGFRIVLE